MISVDLLVAERLVRTDPDFPCIAFTFAFVIYLLQGYGREPAFLVAGGACAADCCRWEKFSILV